VELAATKYAQKLGLNIPHTVCLITPTGTVAKVMSCTEGAHLSAMDYYLRWVQYPIDDPQMLELQRRGYPVKDVSKMYKGHCVVGFPTKLPIVDLMGDKVVTASDVTIEEQYKWLMLLEKYWLGENSNSQISFTTKYDPDKVSYIEYMKAILEFQPKVRCTSFAPQVDLTAYAYTPEERISREEFDAITLHLDRVAKEAYDPTHLACSGGACPIEADRN
jgi:hypothetical protein